jgi:ubiquinone/menaquinone biosynthesis C-methylase UbiE
LELGSGLGLLGKAIKEEVGGDIKYFGVELAYNPAKKSKENLIEPTQADVISLPFPDESFDAIVSTDVLEHIPDAQKAVEEIHRVLKPGGKAFFVIADPSEARFENVRGHIDRTKEGPNIPYWEELFKSKGFELQEKESQKYRSRDWRKIFNLPFLVKLKNKPGFACAFNPVNRPGTYVLEKV